MPIALAACNPRPYVDLLHPAPEAPEPLTLEPATLKIPNVIPKP